MTQTARSWNDQPAEVEGTEVLLTFTEKMVVVEFRRAPTGQGPWYLTAGSLFGSQTLRCDEIAPLLRLAHQAVRRKTTGKPVPMDVPEGVTLLEVKPTVTHTCSSPFPMTAKSGQVTVVDETCRCGALRSDHNDTLAYGHGDCPATGCSKFSYADRVTPGDR